MNHSQRESYPGRKWLATDKNEWNVSQPTGHGTPLQGGIRNAGLRQRARQTYNRMCTACAFAFLRLLVRRNFSSIVRFHEKFRQTSRRVFTIRITEAECPAVRGPLSIWLKDRREIFPRSWACRFSVRRGDLFFFHARTRCARYRENGGEKNEYYETWVFYSRGSDPALNSRMKTRNARSSDDDRYNDILRSLPSKVGGARPRLFR